ncbi:MAG TPA: aminotransferase class V-fold PLP-dependent enzyme [Chthonomonadales bacterium]|nr:aminotransferase class V-fold PLP-dependent enzyme [Chthonomonadales bacterium]
MIYLDNAATSWPKPEPVYRAMDGFMRHVGANPGRSGHRLSIQAARVIFETRESLARLFGVDDPLRIVFASNATEALNLVVRGLLRPGDHVITSSMEHNSVMRPLRGLEEQGVELTVVRCSVDGCVDPRDFEEAIRRNTRLIVMTHASNVVGTLFPVSEVGAIARRHGVLFCVDAAQTAGAYPLCVPSACVDLLAFTGHKSLFGPQGTGGLAVGPGVEKVVEPLIRGGTGSRSDSEHQPDWLPDRYESGTPNAVGLAGLGAGVQFVLSRGVEAIRAHEEELMVRLIEGLRAIPGVTLYGRSNARDQVAVLSFNIAGIAPSEVALRLDEQYDIQCRPGLQCAPIAHRTVGTFPVGTVRVSPGYFTTGEEVDVVVRAVWQIARSG